MDKLEFIHVAIEEGVITTSKLAGLAQRRGVQVTDTTITRGIQKLNDMGYSKVCGVYDTLVEFVEADPERSARMDEILKARSIKEVV